MDIANYLVEFKSMEWESPAPGARQKAFMKVNQKMRLLEFSDTFVETGWCTKGHVGYVLEGRMSVDFNGEQVEFKAGDGICIPEGEACKHKASVAKGEKVLLVLFEKAETVS